MNGSATPVSPRKKNDPTIDYFKHGFYSTTSGTTKYITSKQFRRMLRKSKALSASFQPVYHVLLMHKAVFQQKLPSCLPPRQHGEHVMEVIMDWAREMRSAGLIRLSKSPHGAPTFYVKKPVGWRIVHDYRAMSSHTV
ncbi:putative reverse transcriptase domain-containing protein [Phytophthora infestans]|uniref:Putative reverse transcriptase domain-containing protein n=1 Tax=Phytophthora infestans TaxID=4787 RepID=A0A833SD47_PHYIN|nr:putative reverse transcriptase domain-containing protein [Phytophthora infestans]